MANLVSRDLFESVGRDGYCVLLLRANLKRDVYSGLIIVFGSFLFLEGFELDLGVTDKRGLNGTLPDKQS